MVGNGVDNSMSGPRRTIETALAQYELGEVLGQGGMGVVRRGKVLRLNHTMARRLGLEEGLEVALKAMLAGQYDEDELQRFDREARVLNELVDPNIMRLLDYRQGVPPVMVMPVINGTGDGVDLKEIIESRRRKGRMPYSPEEACTLVEKLARAIDLAHSRGIIHRDLKPANIMFDDEDTPVIADFGLARMSGETSREQLTRTGDILGTPLYLAPEQFDSKRADKKADIYALGMITYQLLTGELPFGGATLTELLEKVATKDAPRISSYNSELRHFDEVFQRVLHKDPNARYESCDEFVKDFKRALRKYNVANGSVQRSSRSRRMVREEPGLFRKAIDYWRYGPNGRAEGQLTGQDRSKRLWIAAAAGLVLIPTLGMIGYKLLTGKDGGDGKDVVPVVPKLELLPKEMYAGFYDNFEKDNLAYIRDIAVSIRVGRIDDARNAYLEVHDNISKLDDVIEQLSKKYDVNMLTDLRGHYQTLIDENTDLEVVFETDKVIADLKAKPLDAKKSSPEKIIDDVVHGSINYDLGILTDAYLILEADGEKDKSKVVKARMFKELLGLEGRIKQAIESENGDEFIAAGLELGQTLPMLATIDESALNPFLEYVQGNLIQSYSEAFKKFFWDGKKRVFSYSKSGVKVVDFEMAEASMPLLFSSISSDSSIRRAVVDSFMHLTKNVFRYNEEKKTAIWKGAWLYYKPNMKLEEFGKQWDNANRPRHYQHWFNAMYNFLAVNGDSKEANELKRKYLPAVIELFDSVSYDGEILPYDMGSLQDGRHGDDTLVPQIKESLGIGAAKRRLYRRLKMGQDASKAQDQLVGEFAGCLDGDIEDVGEVLDGLLTKPGVKGLHDGYKRRMVRELADKSYSFPPSESRFNGEVVEAVQNTESLRKAVISTLYR